MVYLPAVHGGWVWDDTVEIAQNPDLRDAGGLFRIWTGGPANPDYFPLKSTVEWIEWHLWGGWPAGFHSISLGLHVVCALLLWNLLSRFKMRHAWLGGLIFVLHPLAVESVAWNSELKNTLSLALLLPAAAAYVDWDSRPACIARYWLSWLLFALALLAKSSVVMFPCCLLLYAWWKRGSVGRRDLAGSAPFFLLSLLLGLATVSFQGHRAIGEMAMPIEGGFGRLASVPLAIGSYVWNVLMPFRLMPIYPRWGASEPGTWIAAFSLIGLAAASVVSWRARRSWGRPALFGLGCFTVNLLPVLGLVPMAFFRIAWVSDHFAYASLACAAGLAAAGFGRFSGRWFAVSVGFGCLVLAGLTRSYAGAFHDDRTFWSFALDRNPQAWIAHDNLGKYLAKDGRTAEAVEHFRRATILNPDGPEGWYNLGLARQMEGGSPSEDLRCFEKAVALKARFPEAQYCLGNALIAVGRPADAIAPLKQALAERPNYPEAEVLLGSAFAQISSMDEALPHLEHAVWLSPRSIEARMTLASAQIQADRFPEAIASYRELLRFAPNIAEAHNNLGILLAQGGHLAEARAEFEDALRIRPNYPDASANLGRVGAIK